MTIYSRIPARNHYCIWEWHFKNVIWNFWEEILRNTTIATINLKCLGSHYHSVFDFQKSKKARFICEVIKLCILGCKDSTKFQFFSRFCVSLGTEFKLFVRNRLVHCSGRNITWKIKFDIVNYVQEVFENFKTIGAVI